jgi:hypothetical protein
MHRALFGAPWRRLLARSPDEVRDAASHMKQPDLGQGYDAIPPQNLRPSPVARVQRSRGPQPPAPGARRRHSIEAVGLGVRLLRQVRMVAAGLERQRLEAHARRVEVFLIAALLVDAVEATDDEAVDHVDHRLGRVIVRAPGLEGVHAFLQDGPGDFPALLGAAHVSAGLAVHLAHVVGAAYRHYAHAVGTRVGLHDDEGLLRDAVLGVLLANVLEQQLHVADQAFLALALHEIDLAAVAEQRIHPPGIDAGDLAELGRDVAVVTEVLGLETRMPAGAERRHDGLFDALENRGDAGRQIVVQ